MARGSTHRGPRKGPGIIGGTVGALGELLITAGLVLVLFIVWQLWWTDVVADREQDAVVRSLEDEWGVEPHGTDGAQRIAPHQEGPPPTAPVVGNAQVFATIRVPAFDRPVVPVAEGVGLQDVLNVLGAGHYPGTAMPGEVGNFSVAGHRTTYGKPFHDIDRLQEGDPIVVETRDAYYVYTVTSHEIVLPHEVSVIAPNPADPTAQPTERTMTMTACHPLYSARERYIVHARFAYWTLRSEGIPEALAGTTEG
ncbi:class E sortase [Brachybacterium sp. AOP25-B2-12]|uniref:class E sortase n=1 Tax=Brachybacterium sp. AOP25-B2-12 TaxID=3457710 RepID=UPI004034020B